MENTTRTVEESAFDFELTADDANWILTASFIIFTMQTGFGLLESGCVSVKNEANIMMKNVVDVVFGGFTYWAFGFSMSFGNDAPYSTPYLGVGEYMVDADQNIMGPVFACFMFQLSFATTATTIVSGTMAERCNFKSYCLFSMLNTIVYCVPARWIWGPTGFLKELGVVDIAGSGAVHLLGGVSGYVAAWMLGPRLGRYDNGTEPLPLGNPTTCVIGLYILWWGWLAFNSGSTFGISGMKWKFAARAAASTLVASIGGGIAGCAKALSRRTSKIFGVMDIINPVLGGLVAVTAGCALYHTLDAFVVGILGGVIVLLTNGFADWTRVDDPLGATPVHAFGGAMGLLCVGLFAEDDQGAGFSRRSGIFRGGSMYLLKVQLLAMACITIWAAVITFILLFYMNFGLPVKMRFKRIRLHAVVRHIIIWLVHALAWNWQKWVERDLCGDRKYKTYNLKQITNRIIRLRMEPHEELLGADFCEHLVRRRNAGISAALSVVGSQPDISHIKPDAVIIGQTNPVHDTLLGTLSELTQRRWSKVKSVTRALGALKHGSKVSHLNSKKSNLNVKPNPINYVDLLGSPKIAYSGKRGITITHLTYNGK